MKPKRRLLIVGNGMVGERLLDEIVRRNGTDAADITVVGEETHHAYNRIMLSRIIAGAPSNEIVSKTPDWYEAHGITLITGRWVQRLDCVRREAIIGNGEAIGFDHCVLATGSSAWVPPITGIRQTNGELVPGVHVLRAMDDALQIRAEVSSAAVARRVAIIGGGLLGLELAKIFVDLGHLVTVVHPKRPLMGMQLDDTGGTFLQRTIEQMGINVVFGSAASVLCQEHVEALTLEDGNHIPADTVVVATGTRPRIETAASSGITVNRGIVVDDYLTTSVPTVSAVGECVEHLDVTYGLVAPGWEQAEVLADLLTGTDRAARYLGSTSYCRLKVAGVDVASMGLIEAEEDDDSVVQVIDGYRGAYRKLIVRKGLLAGAVIVGDPQSAPTLIQLLDRGDPVPSNAIDLFCSADAYSKEAPGASELCNCNRVSVEVVVSAIAAGARTVESLREVTRAGTGCGSCVGRLGELLQRSVQPVAL